MTDLSKDWSSFIDQVRSPAFLEFIVSRLGGAIDSARWQTEHYVDEANHTFTLLKSENLAERRLMEVGCGPGFVSAFFERLGFDIFSIEPEDQWFGAVTEYFALSRERRLQVGIEQLLPEHTGSYDLIFSNNVLEHVEDFEECVSILSACLKPGGLMIHNLPNYFIPYEPHFGIPLVPFYPKLTEFLIPRSMKDSGLWRSLNFATAWQLERVAKKLGANVSLRKKLMSESFERLLRDSPYTARHPALARVAKFTRVIGIVEAIKLLPPHLATPMVFEWRV